MKCPKCSFTSFDYLDNCKRCGTDLRDVRTMLQIIAVSPEERAPATPVPPPSAGALPEPQRESSGSLDDSAGALEDLDFEGSFDDLVEPTSHAEPPSSKAAGAKTSGEEEELLDLDFGDLFGDEERK